MNERSGNWVTPQDEFDHLARKWMRRVDEAREADEALTVTHEEYAEIQHMEDLRLTLRTPQQVQREDFDRISGRDAWHRWVGTPVVVANSRTDA